VQDSYSYFWDEDTVVRRLDEKITKAYHTVAKTIAERGISSRLAAMVVGVARVADSCKVRGWV
jgi:glutamate dehydrogenase (NAD(P)+)